VPMSAVSGATSIQSEHRALALTGIARQAASASAAVAFVTAAVTVPLSGPPALSRGRGQLRAPARSEGARAANATRCPGQPSLRVAAADGTSGRTCN
jgi:hypothetical protein